MLLFLLSELPILFLRTKMFDAILGGILLHVPNGPHQVSLGRPSLCLLDAAETCTNLSILRKLERVNLHFVPSVHAEGMCSSAEGSYS